MAGALFSAPIVNLAVAGPPSQGGLTAWITQWVMPLATPFVGALAVWLFSQAQVRWKRREFYLQTIARMNTSPGCRNALLLLYFPARQVDLWADPKRLCFVEEREAAKAILPARVHPFFTGAISDDNAWIEPQLSARRRLSLHDSFVDLAFQLEYVRASCKSGLLNRKEACALLREVGSILSQAPDAKRLSLTSQLLPSAVRLLLRDRQMFDLIAFMESLAFDLTQFEASDEQRLRSAFPELAWDSLADGLKLSAKTA